MATTPRKGFVIHTVNDVIDDEANPGYLKDENDALAIVDNMTEFDYNETLTGHWSFPNSQNVKTYGATGAGAPTDDSAAIQAAVDAAAAAKGSVFFPSGTYYTTVPIIIPSYVKLYGVSAGEGTSGSIIIGAPGINIFSFAGLSYVTIANLTFQGSGCNAIYQTNMAVYCIHLTVHQCNFWANLLTCISVNSIFGKIERSTFGYGGTPGATHHHIYFKGVGVYPSNFNKVTDNRFYNSRGYSCRFDTCYHLVLEGNNWETNGSQTGGTPDYASMIEIAGVYALYVKNNWFETNIYTRMFYFTLETAATFGTYTVDFTGNYILASAYISHLFAGSASPWALHISYNSFVGMAATEISSDDSHVTTFYQNITPAYAGTLSGVNKLTFTSPVIPTPTMSAQGWSKSAWMVGWTTTNLQGWLKGGTGSPTWAQSTVAGWQGNSIAFTTTASGYNQAYITLPTEYFKGKTIMLRGLASRDSGSDSALKLAYNTTEATPTSMTSVGSYFTSATLTDNKAYIDVPAGATYLHVGFASGGWAGVSTIKAFDIWVVNTDELTVPTFNGGVNSVGVGDLPIMTSAEFATKISDETGTGKVVFGTDPTFGTDLRLRQGGSNAFIIEHITDTGNIYIRSFESGDSTGDLILNDLGGNVSVGNASGNVGLYGTTPVARGAALTAQLTTVTHSEPGTPDYAIADPVQNTGFGFSTSDEMLSLLKVVANLQARCAELENRLGSSTGVGLFV